MEASAWRIATGAGRVPAVLDPRKPPPLPRPQPQARTVFEALPHFGYGRALEWRFVEGVFDQLGPATIYTRPLIPIIAGEAVSPLGRLMLMVDSANGISAALPLGRVPLRAGGAHRQRSSPPAHRVGRDAGGDDDRGRRRGADARRAVRRRGLPRARRADALRRPPGCVRVGAGTHNLCATGTGPGRPVVRGRPPPHENARITWHFPRGRRGIRYARDTDQRFYPCVLSVAPDSSRASLSSGFPLAPSPAPPRPARERRQGRATSSPRPSEAARRHPPAPARRGVRGACPQEPPPRPARALQRRRRLPPRPHLRRLGAPSRRPTSTGSTSDRLYYLNAYRGLMVFDVTQRRSPEAPRPLAHLRRPRST